MAASTELPPQRLELIKRALVGRPRASAEMGETLLSKTPALLVDYILTVAVSVAAGILALTSTAPSLAQHKVALSVAAIGILTLVNLRGVRESGIAFALPTYSFVTLMFVMVATGVGKCAAG